MPTDHATDEPPDMATTKSNPDSLPDHTDATLGRPQLCDEATLPKRHGLPPDAMILNPPLATTPPMRCPNHAWGHARASRRHPQRHRPRNCR
jgi:hypothetical protein